MGSLIVWRIWLGTWKHRGKKVASGILLSFLRLSSARGPFESNSVFFFLGFQLGGLGDRITTPTTTFTMKIESVLDLTKQ